MGESQTEPDLDYKGMYKQLSKEKREYKDQLSAVVLSSTNLEALVNKLIMMAMKRVQSPLLEKRLRGIYIPISSKLRLLRFANLIDENLYKNMILLFRIRNRFAHKLLLTARSSTPEFEILKGASISNKFLRELPNDSRKFQLMVSKCCMELVEICRKLDPSSVKEIEIVGDIEEVHEYE